MKKAIIEKKDVKKDVAEVSNVNVLNPSHLLEMAVKQNASIETIEKLLAMRRELKAEWAKEQYDLAMAKFQSECPIIKKTKSGAKTKGGTVAYKYAPLDSIIAQVKDLLDKHGFSYTFKTETQKDGVKVMCIGKHKDGHQETSEIEIPLGKRTDIMSDSQVVASALTFAKRYAFCNVFGIMTADEDDDAGKTKLTLKDLENRALESIENSKTVDEVIKYDEFVQLKGKKAGGEDFSDAFKKKFKKLAEEKVNELESGN